MLFWCFITHLMTEIGSKSRKPDSEPGTNLDNTVIDKRYFKLPFVGDFSRAANKKLVNLVRRCCTENIDARFSFDTFKLGQYFSTKDPVPKSLISHVIYHFSCAGCNACYVGETTRHFEKRVDEHLGLTKNLLCTNTLKIILPAKDLQMLNVFPF